jgi:hypothetical protein
MLSFIMSNVINIVEVFFFLFSEWISKFQLTLNTGYVFGIFFCGVILHPHINISWKYFAFNCSFKQNILCLATDTEMCFFKYNQRVLGLGQLNLLILAAISFKIVSLGMYAAITLLVRSRQRHIKVILHAPLSNTKAPWKSFSLLLLSITCIAFLVWDTFKMSSIQLHFQFGKQGEITGLSLVSKGGWGMIAMLLLVTNSVVFRDVWTYALLWWRSSAAHVQIFC